MIDMLVGYEAAYQTEMSDADGMPARHSREGLIWISFANNNPGTQYYH